MQAHSSDEVGAAAWENEGGRTLPPSGDRVTVARELFAALAPAAAERGCAVDELVDRIVREWLAARVGPTAH